MEKITYDLVVVFGFGVLIFMVVGVQLYFGKVYTRGRRGVKWHEKPLVSRTEAPYVYWTIIGLQSLVGLGLVLVSGFEMYRRLQ